MEDIQKLLDEANEKLSAAKRLVALKSIYPDLKRQEGRWGKKVYASATANASVDSVDLRHNCGCCPDSPLEAWPYLETEYGRVYSLPAMFVVGEATYCQGDVPRSGWKERLLENNIAPEAIKIINAHFEKERQEYIDNLQEDLRAAME